MRIIVNISIVLIVLFSTIAFAAEPNTPAEKTTPVVVDVNQENIAAITVNGEVVTEGQIEAAVNSQMERMGGKIPDEMKAQYSEQIRKRVVQQFVIETILQQQEKKLGVTVGDEEINSKIDEQVAQQNLTLDDFKALLKAYGADFDDYKKDIEKRLTFEKLVEETLFKGKVQEPNEAQIKSYYQENAKQFNVPEKVHVKHILVKIEDGNDPNQAKLEAKAKIQGILDQVKGGGDFEELAKENSACPSGQNGGDLGPQAKGTFVPEFEKAAYALKPGEVSDIVETQFGYHVIKQIGHTDANTIPLEQAKKDIIDALTMEQKSQLVRDYIQKIQLESDIKFANEKDKYEVNPPRPAAPMRKVEGKTEPKVEPKPEPKDEPKAEKKAESSDKTGKKKK